jgi:hypothetical protein
LCAVRQVFSALLLNALAYYPLIKLLRVMKRQGFLRENVGPLTRGWQALKARLPGGARKVYAS